MIKQNIIQVARLAQQGKYYKDASITLNQAFSRNF